MDLFNTDAGTYDFKNVKVFPRQVILGNVPSKSNAYKIIKLPGKKAPVDCPDCGGYKTVPKCKTCEGMGIVYLATKEILSLGKTSKLQKYEKAFALQCTKYRNLMIDGSLRLCIDVYFERLSSDIDGCLKIVQDCLQTNKAIVNDNRIDSLRVDKHKDKKNPRIEFHIEIIGPSKIKSKPKKLATRSRAPKKPVAKATPTIKKPDESNIF